MNAASWPTETAASGRASTVPVVSTNPARCRDCYRCVRVCPVKAVRVASGQAEVVPELCIECASCVRACPQKAKVVRDDLPAVKARWRRGARWLRASRLLSRPTSRSTAIPRRGLTSFEPMADALAELGFAGSGETASARRWWDRPTRSGRCAHPERWPVIASSCPVVVNLVEQVYPDLIDHLAPVVSPMIAHGRYLKQLYGHDAFVVFIGPCIAKKGEATDIGRRRRSRRGADV